MKLTPKQKKFCDYYIQTGNATEACRKAGYKGDNLNRIATENLSKLVIKQYLEKRMSEMDSKRIATAEEVLEILTRVVRGEEKDQFGLEVSIADRIKAGEMILKRYKAFDKDDFVELRRKNLELDIMKKEAEINNLVNDNTESKVLKYLAVLKGGLDE